MKKTLTRCIAAAVMALTAFAASAGPLQFGPVIGANVNSFTTNGSKLLSSDNRCGITAGLMMKFNVPIIGIGFDLSAMYARRSAEMEVGGITDKINYDYIAVPLHLRYDLSLPAVGSIITPAVFTGPNFAFRCGNGVVKDFKANKYNVGWDFGLALTFVKHLQVAASYTLGMNKALSYTKALETQDAGIKGRTTGWTVTAAYLF